MPTPARRFVPVALDVSQVAALTPLYESLLARDLSTPDAAKAFLADFSELTAVVDEVAARLYIDKTCHTDDKSIEAKFLHFVEHVEPAVKPLFFKLQKKYLESPHAPALSKSDPKYAILERKWRADVELFRPENVALETDLTKLSNEFDKICGAMTVTIDGKELTLPQAGRNLEETDRALRERTWRAVAQRRLQDRDRLDALFDQMLPIRQKIAHNAGKPTYRDYTWTAYKRFDYGVKECEAFHAAVEKCVVPLVRQLDRQNAKAMKLEGGRLKPWDTEVDPLGRPPLRPFGQGPEEIAKLVSKTTEVFRKLSPVLAEQFDSLRANGNLDLDSRKGKAPGGYQSTLDEVRQPFIFMNAAGLQGDVETLLHEGGHAFHALEAAAEDLVFLRSAPIEFCEVASMGMELLACDHFDVYYPPPTSDSAEAAGAKGQGGGAASAKGQGGGAARAKRQQLEGNIRVLAWVATIDAFQHWIYTHPAHTPAQRTDAWLNIRARFMGDVDFTGLEAEHAAMWQRQLHIFQIPFYYIEYGIAQLGALQLWLKSLQDPPTALKNYRAALALGGTRPLPQLFSAAGLHFDFSERTVAPLVQAVSEELARLPE